MAPRFRSLIHKELAGRLERSFFSRTVTIEAFSTVRTASGYRAPTPGEVADLRDLAAAIAPVARRGNEERRYETMTVAESTHDILLLGAYPHITTHMRAVDDADEVYDILKVDVDDQRTLTRLQVRQVTPVGVEGR